MSARLVNVQRQKVYGSTPLLLPLIRMSGAESIMLDVEPHIYDNPYPLDHDGLFLDPQWSDAPYYSGPVDSSVHVGNTKMTPAEHAMGMGGFGALGLTAAQQQVQAQKQAAAAAAAQAKAQAQIAATQAKAQIAQQKAQAQADLQRQKAQAQAEANAAKAQAAIAKKNAQIAEAKRKADEHAADVKRKQDAQAMSACAKAGGVWDAAAQMCSGYATAQAFIAAKRATDAATKKAAADNRRDEAEANRKATVDERKATQAQHKADAAATRDERKDLVTQRREEQQQKQQENRDKQQQNKLNQQNMRQCKQQKGFWDGTQCLPQAGQGQCQPGYAIDPITGQCVPISGALPPPPNDPGVLSPGAFPTDPGYYPQPAPQPIYQPYPPQPGSYPPPYPPSPYPPDPSMFGGGIPGGMPSGGGGGGGMPMVPSSGGPGPQINEQAQAFAPGVEQSDQVAPDAENAMVEQDSSEATDGNEQQSDAEGVAQGGVMDSIAKFFTGTQGLSSGLGAPPPWFNTHLGGNAPVLVRPKAKPVQRSTTTGVLLTAGILIAGSAAIYLWSKGNKKSRSRR